MCKYRQTSIQNRVGHKGTYVREKEQAWTWKYMICIFNQPYTQWRNREVQRQWSDHIVPYQGMG